MEASRKPDSIPSDRLIAGEAAHESHLRATALEREHDASELEIIRQHYAQLVRDRSAVLHFLNTHGQRELAGRYKRFCTWFEDYVIHWTYKVAPKVEIEVDAERERRKLYGTTAQWFEDERDARMLEGEVGSDGLFDFERR